MTPCPAAFHADHTNPFIGSQLKLKEHYLIHVPHGTEMLEVMRSSPMHGNAHERRFMTTQDGGVNVNFEDEHVPRIESYIHWQEAIITNTAIQADEVPCDLEHSTATPAPGCEHVEDLRRDGQWWQGDVDQTSDCTGDVQTDTNDIQLCIEIEDFKRTLRERRTTGLPHIPKGASRVQKSPIHRSRSRLRIRTAASEKAADPPRT